ncbi:MAG: hypothetical protein KAS23_14450 [Anaerohalosphaera sp.]|nr:hypothetical protein [Anaerohalosphaera sp.]
MENILIILTIIGFVGALPQIWGSSWKTIWLYYYRGAISWDIVHDAALDVLRKMKDKDFNPTVIIGIGRGGIVAAGLLCSEMVRSKLASATDLEKSIPTLPPVRLGIVNTNIIFKVPGTTIALDDRQRSISKIDSIQLSDLDISLATDDKVVIIVSQNFTGTTLEKVLKLIIGKGVQRENIRTIALFWQRHQRNDNHHLTGFHEPDIYGRVIPEKKTMPWKSKHTSTDRF